jgi:hypothetical protein
MLLKKITPATQAGSDGGNKIAPTMTSDPRGSLTTAERKVSYRSRNTARRSAIVPTPSSGPPAVTTRVGSPPVWVSITEIRGFTFSFLRARRGPIHDLVDWAILGRVVMP